MTSGDAETEQFTTECEAIGSLQRHPNIVKVFFAGRRSDGDPYIVMELLSAGSLATRIKDGPIPWTEAVELGIQMAGALESAHLCKLFHGDIKPGNILMDDSGVGKLADFGSATIGSKSESRGPNAPTPTYAAPEVVDGESPTALSDVYSLACTLFTLVDGKPPFSVRRDEPPVRRIRTPIPLVVDQAIRRAMSKDPLHRPSSAGDFGRLLQSAQAEHGMAVTKMTVQICELTAPNGVKRATDPPEDVTQPPAPPEIGAVDARGSQASPLTRRAVAVAVAAAFVAIPVSVLLYDSSTDPTPPPGTSSSVSPVSTTTSSTTGPTGPSTAPWPTTPTTATAPEAIILGTSVPPVSTEDCRSPSSGSGAAWQLSALRLGGRDFNPAYSCNMFAGGTGSLDFVLGGAYRVLTTSIGFADDSTSQQHMVKYEFIGNGRENLIEPRTLRFGEVQNLEIGLTGVVRLTIRMTESSLEGGTEGPSRPVLAKPTVAP